MKSRASEIRESKEHVAYIEHLQIDDDEPVDNIYSDVQMRLLTEPLFSSWKPDRRFVAMSDVGLFSSPSEPPIVPDVMLAMDVEQRQDFKNKENLSYFVWIRGKVPDVVIEIVSQHHRDEDTVKLGRYSELKIPHYVIWDPLGTLRGQPLRYYQYQKTELIEMEMPPVLEGVGLSLTLWQGSYEGNQDEWLRWVDGDGQLILTGSESARMQAERADKATTRADAMAELLRKQGFDPDSLLEENS